MLTANLIGGRVGVRTCLFFWGEGGDGLPLLGIEPQFFSQPS